MSSIVQINWQVTKGGIAGLYNPTGNYFLKAANNVKAGAASYTVRVEEARLPERPNGVKVLDRTSETVTLSAQPPVEDNCIPVIGFMITYRIRTTVDLPTSTLFTLGESPPSQRSDYTK